MLKEQMEIIANYFTYRSNSGWVEGLNNKIVNFRQHCMIVPEKSCTVAESLPFGDP
jgi:hypothetical protein